MTPTHPSPEAMEAALLVCGHYHGEDLNKQAREHYKRVGCGRCSSIALALDAFARARVEEENRACEAIVQERLDSFRLTHPPERPGELMRIVKAISARRGRG